MRIQPKEVSLVDPKTGLRTLTFLCPMCNEDQHITMTNDEFGDCFFNDLCIQEALPNHTSEKRELLVTGTCGLCWEKMFGFEPILGKATK
jgi:hypothetical protein